MASLYDSLLSDPHIQFATSADLGQRIASLRQMYQQAGLSKAPQQAAGKPNQGAQDPNSGPFTGMGLTDAQNPFKATIGGPGRGSRNRTRAPEAAPQTPFLGLPSPQEAPKDDVAAGLDKIKKASAPKAKDGEDWQAQIDRIEAQYRADRDAVQPTRRGSAMTPTQGPDTGALNPNGPSGPIAPSSAAFIKAMTPHALRVAAATGVDPKLVLAQAALETGWGQHAPNNNAFGIKGAGPSQQTWEVGADGKPYQTTATFRAYKNVGDSFDDYGRLLQNNDRYAPVLAAKTLPDQIGAMAKSGYATDPAYGQKLTSIVGQIPDLDTTDSANAPTVSAGNALRRGGFLNRLK